MAKLAIYRVACSLLNPPWLEAEVDRLDELDWPLWPIESPDAVSFDPAAVAPWLEDDGDPLLAPGVMLELDWPLCPMFESPDALPVSFEPDEGDPWSEAEGEPLLVLGVMPELDCPEAEPEIPELE